MRGRKSDQERLTAHMGFDLTPSDKARIVAAAAAAGFSQPSEYIRRKLLSAHMPKAGRDPQAVRELLACINRFADGLEALARHPDRRIEELFPEEARKQLILKVTALVVTPDINTRLGRTSNWFPALTRALASQALSATS
jgi:hypothetical protein